MARLVALCLLLTAEVACAVRLGAFLRRSAPDDSSMPFENANHRLSADCKEPRDPPRTADGEGPVVVFCCTSATAKVAELKRRQKDCNDEVPCSASWKELLPGYMDYYQGLEKVLCRTTTTTTSTTTTTTTVTTTTLAPKKKENVKKDSESAEEPKETTTTRPPFSCKESCLETTGADEAKCAKLCDKVREELEAPTCPWIMIQADAYCSKDYRQLSATGAGTSAEQCESMASADSMCGNMLHHNADMCVCILKGHVCDFSKSMRGNNVYAKAAGCKEPEKKTPEKSEEKEQDDDKNHGEEEDDDKNEEPAPEAKKEDKSEEKPEGKSEEETEAPEEKKEDKAEEKPAEKSEDETEAPEEDADKNAEPTQEAEAADDVEKEAVGEAVDGEADEASGKDSGDDAAEEKE